MLIIVGWGAKKIKNTYKVEKIFEDSLDLIPSPSSSVEIQIMGGQISKGKTLLGIVDKVLLTQ